MNLPLRTAFAVSHSFWVVVSPFSFVYRKFLISSLIAFLTHSLFIACYSISMNLSVFEFFSLRVVSSLSFVVRQNDWYDFNFFEFVEACFVSFRMVYLLKYSMCIWKKCVFCFWGLKGFIYISVKSFSSRALFNAIISLLIFSLEDLSIFDMGC